MERVVKIGGLDRLVAYVTREAVWGCMVSLGIVLPREE